VGTVAALWQFRPSRRRELTSHAKAAALLTGAVGLMMPMAWEAARHFEILYTRVRQLRLVYFEFPLLPFYGLFVGYALAGGFSAIQRRLPTRRWPIGDMAAVLLLVVAVVPRLRAGGASNPYPQPARETPITAYLEKAIGIKPGSQFKGRVATMWPADASPEATVSWDAMIAHDMRAYQLQGNDHRFVGLWAFQIPTLQEFSQLLTPGAYFWITRGMSNASDKQDMRNSAIISVPNVPLLRLLGVRYLITPKPLVLPDLSLRVQAPAGDRLYEISNANLGQYYARRVVRAASASEMLRGMASTQALMDTTWVFEPVPTNLSAASAVITLVPAGFRVQGTSSGTSLSLLPFVFNRCYSMALNGGDSKARLVRANLNMLGLLFTGSVDATLTLETGPWNRPGCLAEESRDLAALGLSAALQEFSRGSLTPAR
jgi:hypothetical protein